MKAKVILEASYQEFKDWQQDILEIDGKIPSLEEFKEKCIEHFLPIEAIILMKIIRLFILYKGVIL